MSQPTLLLLETIVLNNLGLQEEPNRLVLRFDDDARLLLPVIDLKAAKRLVRLVDRHDGLKDGICDERDSGASGGTRQDKEGQQRT